MRLIPSGRTARRRRADHPDLRQAQVTLPSFARHAERPPLCIAVKRRVLMRCRLGLLPAGGSWLGACSPSRREDYRLAGGRVEDALRAPLRGRAAPGPWPVRLLARDGSSAGKGAAVSAPAGVVGWVAGPGVACPKRRWSGCEPAAREEEWFPGCPPGLFAQAAVRRASACRQAKIASLICLFRQRRASFRVLPSAGFLS